MNELEVIASEPTCIHLFLLHDFQEVESLKYAIEKSTCEGTSHRTSRVAYHDIDANNLAEHTSIIHVF